MMMSVGGLLILCLGNLVAADLRMATQAKYGYQFANQGTTKWNFQNNGENMSMKTDGIKNGWNTSIGNPKEREAAAKYFDVHVEDNDSLWRNNVMTPFIGKTLHMTDIEIEERNPFNTLIQLAVKTGKVLWTIEDGPSGTSGPWIEHINGGYTGSARTAGYVSRNTWIEKDSKEIFGQTVANDWGIVTAASATETTIVMKYWSYNKGKFTMTWTVDQILV